MTHAYLWERNSVSWSVLFLSITNFLLNINWRTEGNCTRNEMPRTCTQIHLTSMHFLSRCLCHSFLGVSLNIPTLNTLRNDFTTKAFKRPHATLCGFSLPCLLPSLSPVPDQPASCASQILKPDYLILATPMLKKNLSVKVMFLCSLDFSICTNVVLSASNTSQYLEVRILVSKLLIATRFLPPVHSSTRTCMEASAKRLKLWNLPLNLCLSCPPGTSICINHPRAAKAGYLRMWGFFPGLFSAGLEAMPGLQGFTASQGMSPKGRQCQDHPSRV